MKGAHSIPRSARRKRANSGRTIIIVACCVVAVALVVLGVVLLAKGFLSFPNSTAGSSSFSAVNQEGGSSDAQLSEDAASDAIAGLGMQGSGSPGLASQEAYSNARFGYSLNVPEGFVVGSEIDDGAGVVITCSSLHMVVTVVGYNNDRELDAEMLSGELWNGSDDSIVRVSSDRAIIYQYDDEYEYFIWAYVGAGSIDQMTIRYPLQDDNRDELDAAQTLMQGFIPGDLSISH